MTQDASVLRKVVCNSERMSPCKGGRDRKEKGGMQSTGKSKAELRGDMGENCERGGSSSSRSMMRYIAYVKLKEG